MRLVVLLIGFALTLPALAQEKFTITCPEGSEPFAANINVQQPDGSWRATRHEMCWKWAPKEEKKAEAKEPQKK